MTLTIPLESFKTAGITPNEVFYLIGISQKEPVFYYLDLTNLENKGYIKRIINDETSQQEIVLRNPALRLLKSLGIDSSLDIEAFVEDYRNLFPVGYKTFGQAIRGDKQGCIKKMKAFKRLYDYSNDEILEATRVYLAVKKKDGYNGTQLAHYFIDKDGISSLAAMCDDLRLKGALIEQGEISGTGQSSDI